MLSSAKHSEIRRTADSLVPAWRREEELLSTFLGLANEWLIDPSTIVRGASRVVSCDIATVTEGEHSGGFVLWEISICSSGEDDFVVVGVFTCASAKQLCSFLSEQWQ